MDEINPEIPFLWKLNARDDGWCVVTLVVPVNKDGQSSEHAIPTSVLCLQDENMEQPEEVLEWSEEDIHLFIRLITSRSRQGGNRTGVMLSKCQHCGHRKL
jgi:hypothetical protein